MLKSTKSIFIKKTFFTIFVSLFDCAKINKLVYTSFLSPASTLGKLPVSLHEYLPSQ